MSYFTIYHWISVGFFIVLFLLLSVLIVRYTTKKTLFSLLAVNFVFTFVGILVSIPVIDKYTKKASVKVNYQRILMNEKLRVFGEVKNVGKFFINYCKLDVTLANQALGVSNLVGKNIYNPRGFSDLKKQTKGKKAQVIREEIIIARKLKPGEKKRFSKYIPYPPYFKRASFRYKLICK